MKIGDHIQGVDPVRKALLDRIDEHRKTIEDLMIQIQVLRTVVDKEFPWVPPEETREKTTIGPY